MAYGLGLLAYTGVPTSAMISHCLGYRSTHQVMQLLFKNHCLFLEQRILMVLLLHSHVVSVIDLSASRSIWHYLCIVLIFASTLIKLLFG